MTEILALSGISKRFGGLTAVSDLTFSLDAGEVVGLLGPNGSGKTTVMNMISGYFAPTQGTITLKGEAIQGLPSHRVAPKGVARTFQLVRPLPSLTVAENVETALAFGRHKLWGRGARERALHHLEEVGLTDRAEQRASDLTYIDQKRMELARALAAEPDLLLLDEWLAGLNPTELRTGIELIRSLEQRGMTILLVEHVMDAIRAVCGRCVVMNAGQKIADGATDEVLRNPQVVRAYLGDDHA